MGNLGSRLLKLEREQLEAAIGRAKAPHDFTDAELFEIMLRDLGMECTAASIAAHMDHFNRTGELPRQQERMA